MVSSQPPAWLNICYTTIALYSHHEENVGNFSSVRSSVQTRGWAEFILYCTFGLDISSKIIFQKHENLYLPISLHVCMLFPLCLLISLHINCSHMFELNACFKACLHVCLPTCLPNCCSHMISHIFACMLFFDDFLRIFIHIFTKITKIK